MNKLNLIIGGVPEHFNLPWHQLIENPSNTLSNLNLTWKDFRGGTGAMCKALRSGEIDIAIILTEGIVKDIIAGNPSKIVQTYVQSPLLWGIHVSATSSLYQMEDIQNTTVAISRYGSGSHLMSYVLAARHYWKTELLKFNVVHNLEGAVQALTDGKADYFLWEHFTTKPLVDQGIFRRIGDCPTPWPCFVIAIREEILNENSEEISWVLKAINEKTTNFKTIPQIEQIIANRYEQKVEDIQEWLKITEWSHSLPTTSEIDKVQTTLHELELIQQKTAYQNLIFSL